MADNIKGFFRLLKLYARMDLIWLLQDKATVLLVVITETLSNLSGMAGVLLLAIRFGGVGGLTADEILFMLGFFELADGLGWMLFGNYNVIHISRRIGRGQVDHMLIQPRPLWMQLLTEGFMPFSGCHGVLIGVILTWIAVARLNIALSPMWFLLLLYYLVIHIVLRLSQSFLYGSAAFYKPVACEEISSMILDMNSQLGRFPLFGLPGWLGTILHTVLPIGLLAYFPALALLKDLGKPTELAFPLVVASLFLTAALICFKKGLSHYAKYSCNRYKEMGHRC
ncbi:MAG: ABC-2 family transporter protein [Lachnospiraceae bacterium]|nr:ABC-2 family transporter protein [Lachnospiraceae bacterium]